MCAGWRHDSTWKTVAPLEKLNLLQSVTGNVFVAKKQEHFSYNEATCFTTDARLCAADAHVEDHLPSKEATSRTECGMAANGNERLLPSDVPV